MFTLGETNRVRFKDLREYEKEIWDRLDEDFQRDWKFKVVYEKRDKEGLLQEELRVSEDNLIKQSGVEEISIRFYTSIKRIKDSYECCLGIMPDMEDVRGKAKQVLSKSKKADFKKNPYLVALREEEYRSRTMLERGVREEDLVDVRESMTLAIHYILGDMDVCFARGEHEEERVRKSARAVIMRLRSFNRRKYSIEEDEDLFKEEKGFTIIELLLVSFGLSLLMLIFTNFISVSLDKSVVVKADSDVVRSEARVKSLVDRDIRGNFIKEINLLDRGFVFILESGEEIAYLNKDYESGSRFYREEEGMVTEISPFAVTGVKIDEGILKIFFDYIDFEKVLKFKLD